jgi:LL-diaminopimelate aminotransferase
MPVKKIVIDKANRIYQLPPEIMSFMRSEMKPSLIKKTEVLDLATFRWPVLIDSDQLPDETGFRRAGKEKIEQLKEELAGWFLEYHKAKLNPLREIFIGGGITSTVLTLAQAFIDGGDIVFVPDIGVPLYRQATAACGGQPVSYVISQKNDWIPTFEKVNTRLGRVARFLFLNSPHNPTGAELSEKDLDNLVWLAGRENIAIVNDAAYQAISGRKHTSLMSIVGGKNVGIEVYSFAYLFGLPALPFGFAVGNRDIINGLQTASRLNPPYLPEFYVDMAIRAIRHFPTESIRAVRKSIDQSLAEAVSLLDMLGLEKTSSDAVPFVWAKLKRRSRSTTAAGLLYRRSRVLVAPGTGFGDSGRGFLRLSLTAPVEVYQAANARIKKKSRLLKMEQEQ